MSEMIVDESISVSQAAIPQPRPHPFVNLQAVMTDSFTIEVDVVNPDDANTVALHIPMDMLYVRIAENFDNQITWRLIGESDVIWDNPSIVFSGSVSVTPVVSNDRKTVTIDWANTDPGVSFTYTMNAVITIGNLLIPIRHDPTVHNEPPTI